MKITYLKVSKEKPVVTVGYGLEHSINLVVQIIIVLEIFVGFILVIRVVVHLF